jgi:hypothetical protein
MLRPSGTAPPRVPSKGFVRNSSYFAELFRKREGRKLAWKVDPATGIWLKTVIIPQDRQQLLPIGL